ncbi:MAG: UDP-N-acetylmuramoyl-L-alanine--D-glutamate ligase [Anaerostipes sp.]|uniref:UDP-N-acetylmuramoyl-L-alanine--D-glutamate ligase n=1 Tax=Anaerostipes sp. 992a TaxID=1261637 RepID=UPI0009510F16|nr:UDP-N-acetylmuramoyl-L-alanine--D-glutamate ligase [Anaerostipes sp. 992a]MCI5950903.1 UDP-N-acetylmuramoyl-L-alanine--D-glutamate ligase [Anaerostipes sp.]MDD5968431.1 UDP-N-acetylmuramoyl-L-alanine--D-glutamate ligase [Anaerostipes sp.]OLR62406.1 UDP-N-acetylmuramoylalanine--D-glutamate ligase [Anaerostipes sp. 992a]
MELEGKRVLVAGTGISGIGAANLLTEAGIETVLYDGNEALNKEEIRQRVKHPVEVILGELTDEMIEAFDLMVLSPGISVNAPFVQKFKEHKIPVWSEIELAYYFSRGEIAAITGTNGKTTTTALVGEIVKCQYDSSFVVGNIGIPYTNVALDTKEESVIVAEISSFQLETIQQFRPKVSAVLNITPDHLDRHGTVECYADTKLKIAMNQTENEYCVLNYDDPTTRAMGMRIKAVPVYFSRLEKLEKGVYLDGDDFVISWNGTRQVICTMQDINLLGGHNHENILAAIAISYFMGVKPEAILEGVRKFKGVAHRIEFVAEINGVAYYNDSKGTNPDAAIKGIQAMNRPTYLIGGGYDKKSTYDEWIDAFDGKVKSLILLGQTAEKIAKTAKEHGFDQIVMVDSLEEAVNYAADHAEEGDAVLLSPACASWGMFKNYEVRGDQFKEFVHRLS